MVPAKLGYSVTVLAAMATLAPSLAQRLAISRPMPLEAPEIKMVYPRSEPRSEGVKSKGTKVRRVHMGMRVDVK